jgi:hypothetical protein
MVLTIKCATTVACAVGGLGFGLAAAWYWGKSTQIPVDPLNGDPNAIMPVLPELEQLAWLAAQVRANREIGRLNRIAAQLTALAIVLSTASTLLGLIC